MTPAQRERVDELFGDLCERSAADWDKILLPETDPEVAAEVRSLLLNVGTPTKGIATPIGNMMREASGSGIFEDRTAGPGTRFERYRIERRIGQGGMGDVYEAVRDNDFHKRVALKIVRHGLDSELARERFQQERQTLAVLEHPYIARLLDGGEAANGCPYLVLEFVDGEPIDQYCTGHSRDEVLTLFLKVCEAVEYAHRNLVVHRDLKPANILVTSEGEPKLLDFGIAKLLDPGAAVTQTLARTLTPQYASPEQVRGQAITTASDVYSLGVVLYQLLTGRKPYTVETTSDFSLERVICEEPPAPPQLDDELDDILMMALRKEPERRYASAAELARDIARYRDNEPVSAAPDSTAYRVRKYVVRHWIGLASTTVAVLALCIGAGVATYQAYIAKQRFNQVQKLATSFLFDFHDQIVNVAGTTKARALVVKTAMEYLGDLSRTAGSDPELQGQLAQAYSRVADAQGAPGMANLGDRAGAEANYKHAADLYEQLLKRYPAYTTDAVLNAVKLINFYLNDSRVNDAQSVFDHAFVLANPLKKDNSTVALRTLSALYSAGGSLQAALGNYDLNVKYLHQSLEYLDRWAATPQGGDPAAIDAAVGKEHLRVGRALIGIPRLSEAEEEMKAADHFLGRAFALQPQNALYRGNLYAAKGSLSALYSAQDVPHLERFAESATLSRQAIDLLQPLVEAETTDMHSRVQSMRQWIILSLSTVRTQQGTGLAEIHKALTLWDEVSHAPAASINDQSGIMDDFRNGVQVFALNGHHDEARALAARILRIRRTMLAGKPPTDDDLWYLVADLQTAAEAARSAGQAAEADRLYTEAVRTAAPFAAAADRIVPTAYVAADFYAALRRDRNLAGRCTEADQWREKGIGVWGFLAPKNAYAAQRLRGAESATTGCSNRPRSPFFD